MSIVKSIGESSPSICIGSPRSPESVTILSHCSTIALAVVVETPMVDGSAISAGILERAMLAATSLDVTLPDETRGFTLEALVLPAPIELDDA